MKGLLLIALALAAMMAAGASLAPGNDVPAATIWTPEALSTDGYESSPTFSADGRELIYMSADKNFTKWRLLMSRCESGKWTKPVPPSFAAPAPVIEADPGYTPDGKGLYFVSARHDPANEDFDIWYVARTADGEWGEPERLPAPVNSAQSELLPRADASGRLYFGSSRPGGYGGSDIYVAERRRDGGWQVRNVGAPLNTAANEYEAEISHDGKTMILVADRGDRSHLYRFEAAKSGWREVGKIPAFTNVFQVGPLLAPDASAVLFAQADGTRSGEIFRAELKGKASTNWPTACGAAGNGD